MTLFHDQSRDQETGYYKKYVDTDKTARAPGRPQMKDQDWQNRNSAQALNIASEAGEPAASHILKSCLLKTITTPIGQGHGS